MTNVYTVLDLSSNHTKEYVYRLKRSLERNTTVGFRFVCLTNEQLPGIETIPIEAHGQWAKMELCDPSIKGRILYMDLDTVITGNVDFLLRCDASFLCRNSSGERRTAVMSLDESERSLVWDFWCSNRHEEGDDQRQEGQVYDACLPEAISAIQDVFPGRTFLLSKDSVCIPMGCKIVVFSDGLYPRDLDDESWMKKYW